MGLKSTVTAWCGDKTIHEHVFDLGNANARADFAKAGGTTDPDRLELALMDANIQVRAMRAKEPDGGDQATGDGLPSIQCNNRNMADVTSAAIEAIAAANQPPRLFQRGRELVQLRVDSESGLANMIPMNEDALRGFLGRSASWFRVRSTPTEPSRTKVSPPKEIVADLRSLGSWPNEAIPTLLGVVECPTFAADGTLLNTPGYDEQSRLFYSPVNGLFVPEVPAPPTRAEFKKARKLLREDLLGDFLFEDDASETNALALVLQPFVRPMIAGPTPLFLINAATPGSGKGLLASVVSVVATGHPAAPSAPAENDAEWRKRIFAAMRSDPAVFLIDNVNSYLDSASMASALTCAEVTDRPMGESRFVTVPVRCTWVATGNNVRTSLEIARRVSLIRLNSLREDRQNRPATDFKHPDLVGWAKENRGELIHAARPSPVSVPAIASSACAPVPTGALLSSPNASARSASDEEVYDDSWMPRSSSRAVVRGPGASSPYRPQILEVRPLSRPCGQFLGKMRWLGYRNSTMIDAT